MLTFWAYCGAPFLDAARAGKYTATSMSGELSFEIESKKGRIPDEPQLEPVCRYDELVEWSM